MATTTQTPDGTEIEEGDHLLVTTENSVVDNFAGENEMGAQRIEDNGPTSRAYFHDADGNEALYLVIARDEMHLKVAGTDQLVADVVSVEVLDDE